jgi:hypothetical protein
MGSNDPSQYVVSAMFTLHTHIDRVKTGTAKYLPCLSLEHTSSFIKINVTRVH